MCNFVSVLYLSVDIIHLLDTLFDHKDSWNKVRIVLIQDDPSLAMRPFKMRVKEMTGVIPSVIEEKSNRGHFFARHSWKEVNEILYGIGTSRLRDSRSPLCK